MKNNNKDAVMVIRKGGEKRSEHHGGSWKIAYADFMTAMMSFFLVMWLLSLSTPEKRQGVAEFFKTPKLVLTQRGERSSLSDSLIPGGGDDVTKLSGEVMKTTSKKQEPPVGSKSLKKAQQKIQNIIREDPQLNNFSSNLRLLLTKDGLLIQITDSQDRPMFKVGGWRPESYMVVILKALVPVLNHLPNKINITGHTDSLPYVHGGTEYSNWELSVDRANATRRILVSNGLSENKFMRIVGTADTLLQPGTQPNDPLNRRISILVLSPEKEKEIIQEGI
ncbi:TPA: flagellar motor protein MotB [Salmonella enterica]|uniref:Flagellar motor protein MotB n=1 Tax=Salmonella enterica TaxID=28901 RepID=A0A756YCT5_SALER|nr:motility protein MotB [Salmonella enterica subsp. enterica serovar Richmond]HAG0390735.1 flagellar motor protein MotB [Salmonella enterica]